MEAFNVWLSLDALSCAFPILVSALSQAPAMMMKNVTLLHEPQEGFSSLPPIQNPYQHLATIRHPCVLISILFCNHASLSLGRSSAAKAVMPSGLFS